MAGSKEDINLRSEGQALVVLPDELPVHPLSRQPSQPSSSRCNRLFRNIHYSYRLPVAFQADSKRGRRHLDYETGTATPSSGVIRPPTVRVSHPAGRTHPRCRHSTSTTPSSRRALSLSRSLDVEVRCASSDLDSHTHRIGGPVEGWKVGAVPATNLTPASLPHISSLLSPVSFVHTFAYRLYLTARAHHTLI